MHLNNELNLTVKFILVCQLILKFIHNSIEKCSRNWELRCSSIELVRVNWTIFKGISQKEEIKSIKLIL